MSIFTNKPNAKNGIPINAKFRTTKKGILIPKMESPSPSIICKNKSKNGHCLAKCP